MRPIWIVAASVVGCGSSQHAPKHDQPHHHPHGGHHDPLVHRFEKADEWVAEFDDPARDAWQKPAHVVALMKIERGSVVCDLGAGTGYFLSHLSSAVGPEGRVLALDVEPDMVRYMKERAKKAGWTNVDARVVPLDSPDLANESVDRILIVDVWHHIPGREAYAKKLASGLKKGGSLYVVDFTKEAPKGPPKEHRLDAQSVVAELASAGLQASVIDEQLPDQYVVMARRP